MRVIAGTARRLNLKTVPGMETRPTTDRIKETLFNILQPEMPDCRFLDLFSGSGGIGIEALSRGAAYAVFVEKNPKACSCIRDNLSFTKLAEHGKLLNIYRHSAPSRAKKPLTVFLWIRHTITIWNVRYLNTCPTAHLLMITHLSSQRLICIRIFPM